MKPLTLALLASSLAASLGAQPQLVSPWRSPSVPNAREAAESSTPTRPSVTSGIPVLEGRALARAVDRVTDELEWFEDGDAAFARARQEGRPVFWLQALGQLDGYL